MSLQVVCSTGKLFMNQQTRLKSTLRAGFLVPAHPYSMSQSPQHDTLTLHRSLTAFSRSKAADTSSVHAFLSAYKAGKADRIAVIEQQPFLAQKIAQDVLQRLIDKPTKTRVRKPRNRKPRITMRITKSQKLPTQRPYKIR